MKEAFEKLVKVRQSTRGFTEKEIELEKLEKLCEIARLTPSACNSQPWKIYCVKDKDKRETVARATQFTGRNKFCSSAKAFMVLTEFPAELIKDVQVRYSPTHFTKYDIGELIAYITLGAKSLGLDSCIIGCVDGETLSRELGFEERESCNIVVALGYGDAPLREKVRKPLAEVVKII